MRYPTKRRLNLRFFIFQEFVIATLGLSYTLKIIIQPFWQNANSRLTSIPPKQKPNDTI